MIVYLLYLLIENAYILKKYKKMIQLKNYENNINL